MPAMNFPQAAKKKTYSENIKNTYELEQPVSFVAVPGPQGEIGPKGDIGPQGLQGPAGPKGEQGKPGKNGLDGKDGISSLSPSGQRTGWALYGNINNKIIKLGATRGKDGWVRIGIDSDSNSTNENYLPVNNVSLYNPNTQKINLLGLEIGSIVTIRYDLVITTLSNNTEVWFRSLIPDLQVGPTTFVGNLKYQFDYDLSLEHTFFIENEKIKNAGVFSEILTDNDCLMAVKSLYLSVR